MDREPEHPHLPPPSLWPVGFAVALLVLFLGVVISPMLLVPLGALLALVFGLLWLRDARREMRGEPAPPKKERPTHFPPPREEERYPRNVFLGGATLGLGAVIGGLVTVPVLGFAVLPSFSRERRDEIDIGGLTDYPEGAWRVVTFMADPERGEVTRQTAFVRNNGLNDGVPSFTIISNHCAHLGCPVQPGALVLDDQAKTQAPKLENGLQGQVTIIPVAGGVSNFNCPCHGGSYDSEGNRTAGPPVRALDRFAFAIRNGRVMLGLPYSVGKVDGTGKDATIYKYTFRQPGQHVDGPEQWFYKVQPPR